MDTILVWKNFNEQLENLICKKVNHADHCHDILQDVFIKVAQNIDKVVRAENMSSYLYRMADNAVTDHYRKKENKPAEEIIHSTKSIEQNQVIERSFQLADCCLLPMIASLPSIYKEALIMIELEGMKHKDYAVKAGITISNAKIRVQRGKEKLKDLILQCCNFQFDKYGNIVDCLPNPSLNCCTKSS